MYPTPTAPSTATDRASRIAAAQATRAAERAALRAEWEKNLAAFEAAPRCPWCAQPVTADQPRTTMAGDVLHQPCADALEVELWGTPAEPVAAPGVSAIDESDAWVWETAAGLDAAQLAAYSEGYADGAASDVGYYHGAA